MKWPVVVLLASTCFAQVRGNRPNLIDSALDGSEINGGTLGVIAYPESINVNDTLVCAVMVENDTAFSSSFTFADSLGNSWTATSPTTTPSPAPNTKIWLEYTKSTSSGADTITLTRTSGTDYYSIMCGRFANLGAVDVTATATAPAPGGVIGTINTSLTTTTNNDLIVNVSTSAAFGSHLNTPETTEFIGTEGAASPPVQDLLTMMQTGAAGTYTPQDYIYGDTNFSTRAMQSIAFKPALGAATSSIFLADTALPDVGSNVAYFAQLHCQGGTAAQTYSLFSGSLPTGLSLNTSTGQITGTTTATGTYSLGFRCTDGTVTSAITSLTMTVGPTLSVPFIRQLNNLWSGDNGGGNFTMNVNCGSVVVIYARGPDTHGTAGFVQMATGVNNYIKDSLNSPVRRYDGPIPGLTSWPFSVYIIGPIVPGGADTFTIANNQSSSSGRQTNIAVEVTGANVWDSGDSSAKETLLSNVASGSYNTAYQTLVKNTLLLLGSDTAQGAAAISFPSPWSVISSGGDVAGTTLYGTTTVANAGTNVNAPTNFTGFSTTFQQSQSFIVPLRPALPLAACPANFGTGEKFRRFVW